MAKYPAFLPQPVRDSYKAGPNQPYERTLMDDGQWSHIRKWSQIPMGYNLTWDLTFEQAAFHEGWLEYQGERGAGNLEIPIAGATVICKPVTGMPKYNLQGDRWKVSLEVVEYRNIGTQASGTTLPVWPIELPDFESDGHQYNKTDAMAVSDYATGPSESRVRFRDRVSTNEASILVSLEQRNIFWQFYGSALKGGPRWFLAEFSNAKSQDKRRVRLIVPPQETAVGAFFSISLSIETVRAPILTVQEYYANFVYVNTYVVAGYVENTYVGEYQ